MRPLLCLDLEGTLISNAVSQIPRPGLFEFLEQTAEVCDLMIYTSVSSDRVDAIRRLLVSEKQVPSWFQDLPVLRPKKTTKPKAACGREDAFLLDDQPGVIATGESDWHINIKEFLPPYSCEDRELEYALEEVQFRIRLLEPSFRVRLEDL